MKKTAYCIDCNDFNEFEIATEKSTFTVNGVTIPYMEKQAMCKCCGNEIYVAEINDANVDAREAAYDNAFRRIGKRPLRTATTADALSQTH